MMFRAGVVKVPAPHVHIQGCRKTTVEFKVAAEGVAWDVEWIVQ